MSLTCLDKKTQTVHGKTKYYSVDLILQFPKLIMPF